jgi:hypothetical protein
VTLPQHADPGLQQLICAKLTDTIPAEKTIIIRMLTHSFFIVPPVCHLSFSNIFWHHKSLADRESIDMDPRQITRNS